MRSRLGLFLALQVLTGCSGGEFHVDGPLARTPALPVRGTLGLNTAHCQKEQAHELQGFAADQPSTIAFGDLTGTLSAPHRSITSEAMFGDRLAADYQAFLTNIHEPAIEARLASFRAAETGSAETSSAAGDAAHAVDQVDKLLVGIRALVTLPGVTTERLAFSFFGKRGERTVAMACSSTEVAHFLGMLEGPHFNLSCRVVSSADGVARNLDVHGFGSWANYGYAGTLRGAGDREAARFTSQNVVVLGTGGVRGFDLRTETDRVEIGAMSFWQVATGNDGSAEPRAWLLPQSPPGWEDAVAATLALSYVFPWPTSCDDQYLRSTAAQ